MYINGERSMSWIAKIDKVEKHPDADSLDICHVGGWRCISKLGEYQEGDLVIYCSIDSWVPHSLAPFLSKGKKPRTYNGVEGEKIRTIKLRGQLSQGLLLSINLLDNNLCVGEDVTEILGIQKYEAPIPTQLQGTARGNFPQFIKKTDQERIQNCILDLEKDPKLWSDCVIEEKLEGSSVTVYYNEGNEGVCSRNINLKKTETNSFWKAANDQEILTRLAAYCKFLKRNLAIQGELIGTGIQRNIYKLDKIKIHIFDIYDINTRSFLNFEERMEILNEIGLDDVVPCLGKIDCTNKTLDYFLELAEGKSIFNPNQEREGIVIKSIIDPNYSFKVISNRYLLRNE